MTASRATDAGPDATALAALRRRQRRSVGYLLIRCGQLWNAQGIATVNAGLAGVEGQAPPGGGRSVPPAFGEAHTKLLPHLLDPSGIRVTTLARRLGVSKQAVHQLVADLRAVKAVRLAPDPSDRRARLVQLTPAGLAAMARGTAILEGIEARLAPALGRTRMATLRTLLDTLLPLLDPPELAADSR